MSIGLVSSKQLNLVTVFFSLTCGVNSITGWPGRAALQGYTADMTAIVCRSLNTLAIGTDLMML